MSNYYLGTSPDALLGNNPRYFYALRKNANGSMFFVKSDQLTGDESIEINKIGNLEDNFNDFETSVDFFEGINVNHEVEFKNLKYPQYRWDSKSVIYYIDDEGQLVVRINQGRREIDNKYDPAGLSEEE
jgi:hypothetical protein